MKQVAILLAIYQPDASFFQQQLASLNKQTYTACKVYICDDSNEKEWFDKNKALIEQELTNFPFELMENDVNMGSTKTFEKLTALASGDYFAYCDQDDLWCTDKIKKLVGALESQEGVLAYSQMRVIDENNQQIASSFSTYNQRIRYVEGKDTFSFFIRRNCVTGCTMLVESTLAKKAIPFHEDYVHDHWLALYASCSGRIVFVDEPLIAYRIHGSNQIGKAILKQIRTVDDYVVEKLLPEKLKFDTIENRLLLTSQQKQALKEEIVFSQKRINWFNEPNRKHFKAMWRMRHKDKQLITFELLLKCLPKCVANKLVEQIKKRG